MSPYSDAACQEASLGFQGITATGKEFLQTPKMSSLFHLKATILRAVAFTSNSYVSKMIIAAHVPEIYFRKFQEEIGKFWVIAGLSLLPMQEFLLFWALFCKSYYPPADLLQSSVYCANCVTSDCRNAPKNAENNRLRLNLMSGSFADQAKKYKNSVKERRWIFKVSLSMILPLCAIHALMWAR